MKFYRLLSRSFFLILLSLIMTSWSLAQEKKATTITAYIQDKALTKVNLYAAPSRKKTIIHYGITSGTPVVILKKKNKFAQVKVNDKISGWIESKYLSDEPSLIKSLSKAQAKIEQLQIKNTQLTKALNQTQGKQDQSLLNIANLQRSHQQESDRLNHKIYQLTSDRNMRYLFQGGILIIIGMFCVLVIQYLSKRTSASSKDNW